MIRHGRASDHGVISPRGIFVIEIKDYNGWNFGARTRNSGQNVSEADRAQNISFPESAPSELAPHQYDVRPTETSVPHVHNVVVETGKAEFKTASRAGAYWLPGPADAGNSIRTGLTGFDLAEDEGRDRPRGGRNGSPQSSCGGRGRWMCRYG